MYRKHVLAVVFLVALVALGPTDAKLKKKKRGIYHGLHGFGLAGQAAVPFHRGYHPSPYARFPGLHRGSVGGVLPPGYALFPGGASVMSYQRNFPRYPTVYAAGAGLYPGFGVAPVKPLDGFVPSVATALTPFASAPALPAYPAAVPQGYIPLGAPAATGSTQQTFFATYPQKPLIPVAVPVHPEVPAKVPVVVQKPFYTAFPTVVPGAGGLLPAGVYNPGQTVAVSHVQPQFVGVPVATGSASGVTPAIATTLSTGATQVTQQPWRPVVVNHPVSATPTPPSNTYLPSYATSQGQIYISSTPAPSLHDHHSQQSHQTLLDLDQGSLHQQDGSGAFNGQPYDIASNHGRYTGPSSYDVDITHNGYQKKKK